MKKIFALSFDICLLCLASCGSPSGQQQTLKPFCDGHSVTFKPTGMAFSYLQEQGDTRFIRREGATGSTLLTYTADLKRDETKTYHVYLQAFSSAGYDYQAISLLGKYNLMGNSEESFKIRVNLMCGFWGDGTYQDCLVKAPKKTESAGGCTKETIGYSLVYPEVYVDKAGFGNAGETPTDFFVVSLFEQLVTPIQNALDALGVFVDCIGQQVCSA